MESAPTLEVAIAIMSASRLCGQKEVRSMHIGSKAFFQLAGHKFTSYLECSTTLLMLASTKLSWDRL